MSCAKLLSLEYNTSVRNEWASLLLAKSVSILSVWYVMFLIEILRRPLINSEQGAKLEVKGVL